MIELKNVSKEFVSPKKYPGFKGAIKGLFSNEKVRKVAVDDISFSIEKGEISEVAIDAYLNRFKPVGSEI